MSVDYQQKKKEIEAKFNQQLEAFKILQEQANILQQKIAENNAERTRLQGEFRAVEALALEEGYKAKAEQKPAEVKSTSVKPTTVKERPKKKK